MKWQILLPNTPEAKMSENIIPIQSEYDSLIREIKDLRAEITRLIALRDDLIYRVCPALRATYEKEIGCIEREILAAKLYLKEKRRTLEILRAKLNRRELLSYEEAAKQAQEETRSFEEELKRKTEEAERSRKEWEKTAWSSYGSDIYGGMSDDIAAPPNHHSENGTASGHGSDTAEGDHNTGENNENRSGAGQPGADNGEDSRTQNSGKRDIGEEIKKLYREIVKRLHPDSRPDGTVTEHEKELLQKAQEAYKQGDYDTLRRIWDELEGMDAPEEHYEDTPEDLEKLRALLRKLKEMGLSLRREIAVIRGEYPYTMKELLENEELLTARKEELRAELNEIRSANEELDELIRKVRAELG